MLIFPNTNQPLNSTGSSADDFATKYLEGYYTYYTAPEETGEAMAAKLEDEDEALTPMEVKESDLPITPHHTSPRRTTLPSLLSRPHALPSQSSPILHIHHTP